MDLLMSTDGAPPLLCVATNRDAFVDWISSVRNTEPNAHAVVVRGRKMRTIDGLYDEFAAAMRFPSYFGHNWDALDECIVDLSWLPANAYVVGIESAEQLLLDEPDNQLEIFMRLMANAASEWSEPSGIGEQWERAARPFHVILQVEPDNRSSFRERIEEVGASVADFSLPLENARP